MYRLTAAVCPFCEAAGLSTAYRTQWQTTRSASTLQKRRPSRMVLAERVGQGPRTPPAGGRPTPKTRHSPFRAMNQTEAPRSLQFAQKRISSAEAKRANRHGKRRPESERRDPMKALKMQRALANVSYETRGRVKQTLSERSSFDAFDLLPTIKQSIASQALGGLVDVSPTPIQKLAIPALLGTDEKRRRRKRPDKSAAEGHGKKGEMQQFLLAAETGSGKTLAYLLPTIDAMKRAEEIEKEAESKSSDEGEGLSALKKTSAESQRMFELEAPTADTPDSNTARPRVIILVPTSELVNQVGSVVKKLSHTVKYRSALLSAQFSGTVIRNRLFSPSGIDVVVCTPHLLSSIAQSDPNVLSRVTHLVIDEADSLLDRSFSPTTSAIIDRATPSLQQLIFCSATIPRTLDSFLHKRFPDVKRLATPNLHAIPRRVQLSVVDIDKIPYQGNRDLACAQTIWEIGKEAAEHDEETVKKIVVFVNEREKTAQVAEFLRTKGVDAMALNRDSDERMEVEILASFTGADLSPATAKQKKDTQTPTSPTRTASASKTPARQLRNVKVLVMTDLGSRGIDTVLVRHVILYDVPHTSIDFIHRLGRVGRMGRRGRGIVLVGKNDRKDIVKEVREGMFRGQALI